MLVGSIAGWPVSAVTFAKGEPQTVLALSWIAIITSAWTLLVAAYAREDVADGESKEGG